MLWSWGGLSSRHRTQNSGVVLPHECPRFSSWFVRPPRTRPIVSRADEAIDDGEGDIASDAEQGTHVPRVEEDEAKAQRQARPLKAFARVRRKAALQTPEEVDALPEKVSKGKGVRCRLARYRPGLHCDEMSADTARFMRKIKSPYPSPPLPPLSFCAIC